MIFLNLTEVQTFPQFYAYKFLDPAYYHMMYFADDSISLQALSNSNK